MVKVYLAGPFFSPEEIGFIERAETILRKKSILFSPREHDISREGLTTDEWCRKVFQEDVRGINESDLVVMLYYGQYSDSGTAWESGYAFAVGKPVVAVHFGHDSNLMVHVPARANITLDELEDYDLEALPEKIYEGKVY